MKSVYLFLFLLSFSTQSSAKTSNDLTVSEPAITPFVKQRSAPSLMPAAPSPALPQPSTKRAARTERHYLGLEVGITTTLQFGGQNYAAAGVYLDGLRNAELSSYHPGISLMANGVLDIALSKDVGLQGKAGYRQHKARATGISPAGNVSGREPQLENDVYYTWDFFGADALVRYQLVKNGLYALGGLGYTSLLSNYVLGTQTSEDQNGTRNQMTFQGELQGFYSSSRIDAKIGLGTWLPLGESGLMIAPEFVIGIPLTPLHSSETIDNYQAIDREVNNIVYGTIGFAIKFPFGGPSPETQLAFATKIDQPSIEGTQPPQRTVTISGRVVDQTNRSINDARVTVVDLSNNQVITAEQTEYGTYNVKVRTPGRYSVTAEAHGFLFGSTLHEVDGASKSSGEISLSPSTGGRVRLLVFFDFDKATLQTASHPELDRAVALMKSDPTMRVEIAGFTDAQGTDSYNKDLSQRRANSVRDYLAGQGIDGARLTAVGYGEENPVASNDSDAGRAENRRVEFVVLKR